MKEPLLAVEQSLRRLCRCFNRSQNAAPKLSPLLPRSPLPTYLGRGCDGQEGARGEERKGGGWGARHGCEKRKQLGKGKSRRRFFRNCEPRKRKFR